MKKFSLYAQPELSSLYAHDTLWPRHSVFLKTQILPGDLTLSYEHLWKHGNYHFISLEGGLGEALLLDLMDQEPACHGVINLSGSYLFNNSGFFCYQTGLGIKQSFVYLIGTKNSSDSYTFFTILYGVIGIRSRPLVNSNCFELGLNPMVIFSEGSVSFIPVGVSIAVGYTFH